MRILARALFLTSPLLCAACDPGQGAPGGTVAATPSDTGWRPEVSLDQAYWGGSQVVHPAPTSTPSARMVPVTIRPGGGVKAAARGPVFRAELGVCAAGSQLRCFAGGRIVEVEVPADQPPRTPVWVDVTGALKPDGVRLRCRGTSDACDPWLLIQD